MSDDSPLFVSAIELLSHSTELYAQGNERKYKFIILHLANAIELILKDRLVDAGISIYGPRTSQTISIWSSFQELEAIDVWIPERAVIELLVDDRNTIQHRFGSPDSQTVYYYLKRIVDFFRRFLQDEYDVDLAEVLAPYLGPADLTMLGLVWEEDDGYVQLNKLFELSPASAILQAYNSLQDWFREVISVLPEFQRRFFPFWRDPDFFRLLDDLAIAGFISCDSVRDFDLFRTLRNRAAHTADFEEDPSPDWSAALGIAVDLLKGLERFREAGLLSEWLTRRHLASESEAADKKVAQTTQKESQVMHKVWPHEFFRLDFDAMLEEGKRQQEIHPANAGEFELVQGMHSYFDGNVLPLILSDDWVYEAASTFATDHAIDCFHFLKLTGQEVYRTQKSLLDINEQIVDFLARAHLAEAAPMAGGVNLVKASDFFEIVLIDRLSPEMHSEAQILRDQAVDHESLQLRVTLRAIRSCYETPLPRIMYVVRRAIKVTDGLLPKPDDNELTGISKYISWYTARVNSDHALYPVLGELDTFYKKARNVASHHRGLQWKPDSDEVGLPDDRAVLDFPLYEFQQKYRHLIYLCELGLRGILSAFCEREHGETANRLVKRYVKTFPEDFPPGEPGTVSFYPK